MTHRSLDANAAVWRAPCIGMQDVHKLGIASGQSALLVCMLKCGASGIQTWIRDRNNCLALQIDMIGDKIIHIQNT